MPLEYHCTEIRSQRKLKVRKRLLATKPAGNEGKNMFFVSHLCLWNFAALTKAETSLGPGKRENSSGGN